MSVQSNTDHRVSHLRNCHRRRKHRRFKKKAIWVALTLVQGLAATGSAVTLNDGMVHIVNDSIYAGERVEITDSLNGETTLLILQAPGVLGTTMDSSGALVLWGCCGGKAAVEIQGGDVNGSISGGADSCITIAGGTVSVSDAGFLGVSVRMIVYPFEFPRQTFLRMTGGDLIGSVFSAYKGHFLFSGGSVGIGIRDTPSISSTLSYGPPTLSSPRHGSCPG